MIRAWGFTRACSSVRQKPNWKHLKTSSSNGSGNLPREAVSLLSMARIRADCRRLGLLRIDAGPEAVAATLQDWPNFRTSKSSGLRLDGRRVIFDRPSGLEERLIAIEELIDILDEAT
jgi:transcription-repair coupling factor (superfamily II helicase)